MSRAANYIADVVAAVGCTQCGAVPGTPCLSRKQPTEGWGLVQRPLASAHAVRRLDYRKHCFALRRAQRVAQGVGKERRKRPRPVRPWSEIPLLREREA